MFGNAVVVIAVPRLFSDWQLFRRTRIVAPPTALRQLARQIVERLVDPTAGGLRRLAMLEADRIAELDPAQGTGMRSASLLSIVQLLAAHADAGEIVTADLEVAADLFLGDDCRRSHQMGRLRRVPLR